MTNVLPPEDLKRIVRTARAKFALTASLVLSAAAVAGILALSPSFFLMYFSREAVVGVESVPTNEETQRRADQEAASRIRVLLSEISSLRKERVPIHVALEKAYGLRPAGVSIGGVTYTAGEPSTITMAGSAKSRDDVSAFRNALVASGDFENVSVPVAALVGVLEGGFTITLTGKF